MTDKLEAAVYAAFLAAGKQLGVKKMKGLSCLVGNWKLYAPSETEKEAA